MKTIWQKYQLHIEALFILLLAASVRLTSLNVFLAVDEADRWRWAQQFFQALLAGDLPGTLVGDGYPGIFPAWLETIWLFLAALYRSALQGGWIGSEGVYLLLHEWDRTQALWLQRLPVVLANTLLVVIIFLYLRRLFDRRLAWLAAILISLDPFYLSDSRVNRAEGLLTGLMTVSLLALIAAHRAPSLRAGGRQLAVSGLFGGLAWLTKSQALVLLPLFGAISLIWQLRAGSNWFTAARRAGLTLLLWSTAAAATFVLLWPAAWTIPGPTFSLMFNYATRKVGEEGVKVFFLGRTVLDEDPGLLFYPILFVLRATPLMLLGLALGAWLLFKRLASSRPRLARAGQPTQKISWRAWLDEAGLWALLAYALLYIGGMSLGSHKQDRFLMAAFPALNILAAAGFFYFLRQRGWARPRPWLAGAVLLAVQLATALPYHPYYFSYFNPLAGGGPVAAQVTRIGWGEGMDQVADYLQSLDHPEELTVATRFFHYLLGFKGERINLSDDGDWVRADKIVFYIQQYQRMLDPSPGVIRYFMEQVEPEKVITIDGIDYAKIFANPIQYPANPQTDQLAGEMRLFGYRWQPDPAETTVVRLIWQNLSPTAYPVGVRLRLDQATQTEWLECPTRPGFEAARQRPGEVVESDCALPTLDLPPGLYDLQVGVRQTDATWQALEFAAGWSAMAISAQGTVERVAPEVAFAQLADQAIPAGATRLEHTYAERVRLLAYEFQPASPKPGDSLTVDLYWQAVRPLEQEAHVSLQAFLGEAQVALDNGPPLAGLRPTTTWHPGEVLRERRTLALPSDLPTPALLRLDVGLFLPDRLLPLPVHNLAGEDIPSAIASLRLEPEPPLAYQGHSPLNFSFGPAIRLIGYESTLADGTLKLTLYWQATASPDQTLTAFVHLLDAAGGLIAQSDVPPANGLFPTSVWQPGDVVPSFHTLQLTPGLDPGSYALVAGLYEATSGTRLPARDQAGHPLPNNAAPIDQLSLPLVMTHD